MLKRLFTFLTVFASLVGCGRADKNDPCGGFKKPYKALYGEGVEYVADSHDDNRVGPTTVMWADKGFSVVFDFKREYNGMRVATGAAHCEPHFLVSDLQRFVLSCKPEHCAAALIDNVPGLADLITGH